MGHEFAGATNGYFRSMLCPVPYCGKAFRTLKVLSTHLKSSIRGNRCGAYIGEIRFRCECGEICESIDLLKAHAVLHSYSHKDEDSPMQSDHTAIFDMTDADEDSAVVHHSVVMLAEDNIIQDEIESILEPDHILFSELLLVESDDEDDDETYVMHEGDGVLLPSSAPFQLIDFENALASNPKMREIIEIYQYCTESYSTHATYRKFRQLSVFSAYDHLPKNFKDLKRQVHMYVADCHWPSMNVELMGGKYYTPRLLPEDALKIWLSVPSILDSVRYFNRVYLPHDLLDNSLYDELIELRQQRINNGEHRYENFADGSHCLNNIREAIPLFREEYVRAIDDGLEVLVCHFGLYEDDFGKNLNSLVTQTIFCLTLCKYRWSFAYFETEDNLFVVEATTGDASLSGISTLMMMLADGNATKSLGRDQFWSIIVKDLNRLERGRYISFATVGY